MGVCASSTEVASGRRQVMPDPRLMERLPGIRIIGLDAGVDLGSRFSRTVGLPPEPQFLLDAVGVLIRSGPP